MLQKFYNGFIWRSDKNDKEGDGSGRKIPSGFEKLLRRTKRPIKHENKEEGSQADKKEDKEAKKEEDEKAAQQSEDEEETTKKSEKKSAGSSEGVRSYFFEPNGGGPIWENFLMLALLFGTMVYGVVSG